MQMFSSRKPEPAVPPIEPAKPLVRPEQPNRPAIPAQSGAILSSEVSIQGSVKFASTLSIDGEVEGTINSLGTLAIGKHAQIRGDIRVKSVTLEGMVEGNIFASERCELRAGCTLRGDIEAPRLVVDENATFFGSAKITTQNRLPG